MGFQDPKDWRRCCLGASGSAGHTPLGHPIPPKAGSLIPWWGSTLGSHVPPLRGDRSGSPPTELEIPGGLVCSAAPELL